MSVQPSNLILRFGGSHKQCNINAAATRLQSATWWAALTASCSTYRLQLDSCTSMHGGLAGVVWQVRIMAWQDCQLQDAFTIKAP